MMVIFLCRAFVFVPNYANATLVAQFFVNCSIQDFKGQIFPLCKDQQGCRFLQKRLDDGDNASLIFNEIYPHFVELMADPFGNYLCQKLLEFCSPQQKYVVVEAIAGALVGVCLNAHGTRAVQKLCEIVADTDLVYLMIDALRNNVVTLIKVYVLEAGDIAMKTH
jgi:hypothetical protein